MARRRSRRSVQGSSPPSADPSASRRQPLDRLAVAVMAGLALVLGLLIFFGDHATARVRDFSWQDRQVGAEDQAFLITFSRPMDPVSVEENLTLDPPLLGQVSWAGRRMAYTLTEPLPYGQSFTLRLDQARDRFSTQDSEGNRFQPFEGRFQTRPRAFVYIGTAGDEANRLVLADLERQERTILTPKTLSVLAFKPYTLGDRILFSAMEAAETDSLLSQQLYTVTTGIAPRPPQDLLAAPPPFWTRLWPKTPEATPGDLTLVLDNRTYQNLKFDLSADGQTIVVQRVNRDDPTDFGPWVVPADKAPYPLETDPGGDFMIAPDSQSLVLLQGEGTAILDLSAESSRGPQQPLDFLPNYGQVLDIAANGSAAAMVNFNQNDPEKRFTESLFLVSSQGEEEELLWVSGSIRDAQFDPSRRFLYVLASEQVDNPRRSPLDTQEYREQPLLLVIDLEAKAMTKLATLPQESNQHMSLAPDGRSLLLDVTRFEDTAEASPTPEADLGPGLWYLPLFTTADQPVPVLDHPEPFPFSGIQATWLP
ncbi:MAG: Ig-like domain-containing protein [Leptolyngbya sp.]|nr:Ig-like domain-containing protein [Leptolyngbya sp.]